LEVCGKSLNWLSHSNILNLKGVQLNRKKSELKGQRTIHKKFKLMVDAIISKKGANLPNGSNKKIKSLRQGLLF